MGFDEEEAPYIASTHTAVLCIPVTLLVIAEAPIAVLLFPVTVYMAFRPTAVFPAAKETVGSACLPIATLLEPRPHSNARAPMATFDEPVWF